MYLKRWYLKFETEDGRRWSGWINLESENVDDFPDIIKGTFWTKRDSMGTHGFFELGDGIYEENYVLGSMIGVEYKPKNKSKKERLKAFRSSDLLPFWERIEKRIENCICDEPRIIKVY